ADMNTGFMLVRENAFDANAIHWVAAGCNSGGGGWLTRCKRGEVLAAECSGVAVTAIANQLESALAQPEYDDDLALLDGHVFFATILRESSRMRFRASTARVNPRLLRLSENIFDLPREDLLNLLCDAYSFAGSRQCTSPQRARP